MRRMERDAESAIADALDKLMRYVIRDITGNNVQDMVTRLDDEAATRPLRDAITSQLQRIALAGSDFGRDTLERHVFGTRKDVAVGMWELANNAAAAWATEYGYDLVRGLLETTRDRIQNAIEGYIRNGETIGQLTQRIGESGAFGPQRAQAIAVTEVTRAFAEGNRAAWRASGVIEKRRWNTNNDELVCPVCGPLNGKVVGINEPFEGGIDNAPAHVRCRCWITPVVE